MKNGVHQGSTVSPLLFVIVMDILTEDLRAGSLFFCADNLALCGASLDDVMGKYKSRKRVLERKGLRVNVKKAKEM